MNDKQMLELAAKAAGIQGEYVENLPLNGAYRTGIYDRLVEHEWNSLTDDGDAFRLAVKLNIYTIKVPEENKMSARISNGIRTAFIESYTDDSYAATRLAITRAAAEIGKTIG